MDRSWSIGQEDISAVQTLLEATKNNLFVANRIRRNVTGPAPGFSRDEFWRVLMGCLLTTQQKAGPKSVVGRFMLVRPFPLNLVSLRNGRVSGTVFRALTSNGGIRRTKTIAKQAEADLEWLESGGWRLAESVFRDLAVQRTRAPEEDDARIERYAANFAADSIDGLGPKQSRNLWQWLGLTRYEIPIDSRVTDWMNANTTRSRIDSTLLSNRKYYVKALDDIQELCRRSGVLPCIFDAAAFAVSDEDWKEEELDN